MEDETPMKKTAGAAVHSESLPVRVSLMLRRKFCLCSSPYTSYFSDRRQVNLSVVSEIDRWSGTLKRRSEAA
jgi:hypothetical protein